MASDERCVECGSKRLTTQSGEISCMDCGLVLDDAPIEQNQFMGESNKKQAELPYLAFAGTRPVEGRIVKSSWLLSTREKNLRSGLSKIDLISSKHSLPTPVTKEAKFIYKKALYSDIAIGRESINLIYGSVYLACNIHGVPKTLQELRLHTGLKNSQIMKAYKLIKGKLQMSTTVIDSLDLLPRFASKLDLEETTITIAAELLIKMKRAGISSGKRPDTLVAGAIYLAGKKNNDSRTQRQIANAMGVIEVTIRKVSKELTNNM